MARNISNACGDDLGNKRKLTMVSIRRGYVVWKRGPICRTDEFADTGALPNGLRHGLMG